MFHLLLQQPSSQRRYYFSPYECDIPRSNIFTSAFFPVLQNDERKTRGISGEVAFSREEKASESPYLAISLDFDKTGHAGLMSCGFLRQRHHPV
jgi:hypothetical protein